MEYVNVFSAAQSTQLVAQTNCLHSQQPGTPKSKDDPSPAIAVYKGRCKVGYVEKRSMPHWPTSAALSTGKRPLPKSSPFSGSAAMAKRWSSWHLSSSRIRRLRMMMRKMTLTFRYRQLSCPESRRAFPFPSIGLIATSFPLPSFALLGFSSPLVYIPCSPCWLSIPLVYHQQSCATELH